MQVAVLSDSHDNIWNMQKVVAQIKGHIEAVIFCGDFCAPFMPTYLAELGVPIYACLGNNDEDQLGLQTNGGSRFTWFPLFSEFAEVTLGERKIAFCHYPKLAALLAESGEYDAVFHGHNHIAKVEMVGETLLANPGAICGIQAGKPGKASFALYDTIKNSAELMFLNEVS